MPRPTNIHPRHGSTRVALVPTRVVGLALGLTLGLVACGSDTLSAPTQGPGDPSPPPPTRILTRADIVTGGDISFFPEIEAAGGTYSDSGGEQDLLELMAEHNFDAIRLKLWHTPAEPWNDLPRILQMAERIDAAGMDFLLNFHFSDTWADPGNQAKPAAWADLSFPVLVDSLRAYTQAVTQALVDQGTPPWMIQIGNEISGGMLWPDGDVRGPLNTSVQWGQLAQLLGAAREGIMNAAGASPPLIMIHYANGAAPNQARNFFTRLETEGVEFDVMGVSYYKHWHGTLAELETNLADLTSSLDRDVYVVEAAYPWTLGFRDNQNNIIGSEDQLETGFPASPQGQANFMAALRIILQTVPGGRGAGIFYWAPEWIAVDGVPSAWENVTLFDFNGRALPALDSLTAGT